MSEYREQKNGLSPLVSWRLKQLKLNEEQYRAVTLDKANIVVSAAAGSGKTYTMTERIMCRVLAGQAQLAKLLILTFTEKASLNMQEALQRKINDIRTAFINSNLETEIGTDLYKSGFSNLLTAENELSFAQISTIHAFCKQLISDTAYIAKEEISAHAVSVKQAKIADEASSSNLLTQATKRLLHDVMQISKEGGKLELSNFSQDLANILPTKPDVLSAIKSTPSKVTTSNDGQQTTQEAYQELIKRSDLQGSNLREVWQSLLAQVNARKNLDNLLTNLLSAYKQFRAYPNYRVMLKQAAFYADKKANNLKLAPEYSYFLKELEQAYNNFSGAVNYLKTHLAMAILVKKTATEAEKSAVNNYLIYLLSEIDSKLMPILSEFASLESVQKRFTPGLTADSSLALEPDEKIYTLYQAAVKLGRSLPEPPELNAKNGTQAFKFDGRIKLSEADQNLKARYIATVGPLLQLLAPHIKLISDTEAKKFSNIQTELAKLDLGQETYLARAQAKKILLWVELLLALDASYTELKREKQLADFSDLEQAAYALLQDENVSAYCQEHYQEIYVDEYQDTSNIQEAILQKLAKDNLFVVGDIKQSIYGFRNAKLANFQNKVNLAKQKQSGQVWQLVNFNTNYRSLPDILSFCNLVFQSLFQNELVGFDYIADQHYFQAADSNVKEPATSVLNEPKVEILTVASLSKELETSAKPYQVASKNLLAHLPGNSQQSTVENLLRTANKASVKKLEAYLIAEKIKKLLETEAQQDKPATIAVLARSHATLDKVAKVLKECAIPYNLGTSKNDLAEEKKEQVSLQAKELYFLIQALANSADDETICTVLSSSYLEQALSLEDLAEIKAASLDYLTASLTKENLTEEQLALLKSLRYLPYKDVLNLYMAAYHFSLQESSSTADNLNCDLAQLLKDKLPDFLADYAQYIKKDLAIKLELCLEKLKSWRKMFAELGFALAFQSLFSELKLQQRTLDSETARQQQLAFLALRRLVKQTCEAYTYPSLTNLLTYMPNAQTLQMEDSSCLKNNNLTVELLTFHAAKGLEFNYVFIAGLDYQLKLRTSSLYYTDELGFILQDTASSGLVKYASLSNIAAQICERQKTYAEELRLLYVALSRAETRLYLCVDNFELISEPDKSVSAELHLANIFQAKTYASLLNLALNTMPTAKRLAHCLCGNSQKDSVYKLNNLSLNRWLDCLARLYLSQADYSIWSREQAEKQANNSEEEVSTTDEKQQLAQAYQTFCQEEHNPLKQAEFLSKQALLTANSCEETKQVQSVELSAQQISALNDWSKRLSSLLTRLAALPDFTTKSDTVEDISMELSEERRLCLLNNQNMQKEIDLSRDLATYNSKYSVSGIKNLLTPNAELSADTDELEVDLNYGLDLALQAETNETDELIDAQTAKTPKSLKVTNAAQLTADFAKLVTYAQDKNLPLIKKNKELVREATQWTATEKGTLIHRFLQFVDLSELQKVAKNSAKAEKTTLVKLYKEELLKQLANFVVQGIIPEEAAGVIDAIIPKLIAVYLPAQAKNKANPDLYESISSAIATNNVYREFPFVMEWKLEKFLQYFPELCQPDLVTMLATASEKLKNELKISVQGVIDLWFQDGDDIYLVDYKTDHLSMDIMRDEQAVKDFFLKRYRVSMQLYALALQQGLNLSDETVQAHLHVYIYSVAKGDYVALDLSAANLPDFS